MARCEGCGKPAHREWTDIGLPNCSRKRCLVRMVVRRAGFPIGSLSPTATAAAGLNQLLKTGYLRKSGWWKALPVMRSSELILGLVDEVRRREGLEDSGAPVEFDEVSRRVSELADETEGDEGGEEDSIEYQPLEISNDDLLTCGTALQTLKSMNLRATLRPEQPEGSTILLFVHPPIDVGALRKPLIAGNVDCIVIEFDKAGRLGDDSGAPAAWIGTFDVQYADRERYWRYAIEPTLSEMLERAVAVVRRINRRKDHGLVTVTQANRLLANLLQ